MLIVITILRVFIFLKLNKKASDNDSENNYE